MIEIDRDMLSEAVIAYAIKHNEALSNDELHDAMNQATKGIENKVFTVRQIIAGIVRFHTAYNSFVRFSKEHADWVIYSQKAERGKNASIK